MRILIVGDWHSDLHEEEMYRSFERLGHEVLSFKWFNYFSSARKGFSSPDFVLKRTQDKYLAGPILKKINRDVVSVSLSLSPDLIFIYRGTHIFHLTIERIKELLPQCSIVGYNNDDPFSPSQPKYYWRHFKASIPKYDTVLAYRHANVDDYLAAGAKKALLLRSWYVPDRNHPVDLDDNIDDEFFSDVTFIGHYEPDGRLKCLEEIARHGFNLSLFGPSRYWNKPLSESAHLHHLRPTRMLWGDDYNRALCGSSIALCFLSKLNRDTYTRRCFEIPATKTLLLSEYSEDLADLYQEGVEADYFRTPEEMVNKIQFYLDNPAIRKRVAKAGFEKVKRAGHDIDSRLKTLLADLAKQK